MSQKASIELTCPFDTALISKKEIARWVGISEDAVDQLIKKKRFPPPSLKGKPNLWDWRDVAVAMICLRWGDMEDDSATSAASA